MRTHFAEIDIVCVSEICVALLCAMFELHHQLDMLVTVDCI